MGDFLEAVVTLLPADAGGRSSPISPRDGSYRPVALTRGGERVRIRIIEGPPSIAPGSDGLVVVEVEGMPPDGALLTAGSEFDLVEDEKLVGILTVTRLWRRAVSA